MRNACSGFTMIEVMIALLLVGSGALATAMLQLQGMRASRESAWQAGAAAMAIELAELRAAWRAAAPAGEDPYLFSVGPAPAPASVALGDDCATGCDAAGFARAAIAEWSARLTRELPGARAVVCRDGAADAASRWRCDDLPASPVVIKLGWRTGAAATTSSTSATAPLMVLAAGR